MAERSDNLAATTGESATSGATEGARPQGSMLLSIIGLVAGVIALGLAAIPPLAFERALPNPFARTKNEKARVEPAPEREGGVTLKYKKLSVNLGGKVPDRKPQPQAPPEIAKAPVSWFAICAIACALLGLVVSSVGQVRERHTALTVTSMGCCAAAITWQYFAIGIAVGAAAAAFLIVLAILGSAVN